MPISTSEFAKLRRIVAIAEKIIAAAEPAKRGRPANGKSTRGKNGNGSTAKRIRRSGKELAAFRKMLKAERKRGVPVSELAQAHGISRVYIYQL